MIRRLAFALSLLTVLSRRVSADEPRNVAIVVYQGVELLDFAGPAEVLSSAGNGAFHVFTVGPTNEAVVSQGFVRIVPNYSIADSPRPAVIVIPGGRASSVTDDPKMMSWIRRNSARTELTMSVCNGAIVLARAGLLEGLRAITHWGAVSSLRRFPGVTVVPEARFVDTGRVLSTQGVSAGIDGALHVVERFLGAEAAWSDAHYLMYPWEPAGLSQQEKSELRPWIERDWKSVEEIYGRKAEADPKDPVVATKLGVAQEELGRHELAVGTLQHALDLGSRDPNVFDDLASAWFELGKYDDAARSYEREAPLRSPLARPWVQLRAAKAWARAGNKDAAIAALEAATASGAIGKHALESDADLADLRDDQRFQALLERAR